MNKLLNITLLDYVALNQVLLNKLKRYFYIFFTSILATNCVTVTEFDSKKIDSLDYLEFKKYTRKNVGELLTSLQENSFEYIQYSYVDSFGRDTSWVECYCVGEKFLNKLSGIRVEMINPDDVKLSLSIQFRQPERYQINESGCPLKPCEYFKNKKIKELTVYAEGKSLLYRYVR